MIDLLVGLETCALRNRTAAAELTPLHSLRLQVVIAVRINTSADNPMILRSPQRRPAKCFRSSPLCLVRMQPAAVLAPKTGITQNHFKNMKEAEANWARRRRDIKAGKKDSMLTLLEKRGYINQIVGKREDLDRLMTEKRVGIYCGIDPTAPSLHVGHLLPLMVLFWTYIYCYRSCSLIGGATGRIGDPTDRMTRRDAVGSKATSNNGNNIKNLLKTIWSRAETAAAGYGYEREWAWRRQVVNNNEWLNKLSVMEFLHGVGQTARIGPMLGRDT